MTKKIRLYQPFGDLGCQRPGRPDKRRQRKRQKTLRMPLIRQNRIILQKDRKKVQKRTIKKNRIEFVLDTSNFYAIISMYV